MCLLVNVNEEKQNQIKAKSFNFLLRNLNDKHFKMNLGDDTPWQEKADYGGLGCVLQRRFTV